MVEYIKVGFKLAKEIVLEKRSETIPFVITIRGLHSTSPPMMFLLVIDTSYSMDGSKIFRAKQAALKILDLLRDKDYVGVYGFAGKFYKALEPTPLSNREVIEEAIVSLKLGSGTNIYDTLKKLIEEIDSISKTYGTPAIRLIMLTDGQPTVGQKKPEKIIEIASKLSERKISALMIGVGSDYNEKLLLKLATILNGIFEHVDKPELLEKIMYDYVAVSKEISARNVHVYLKLKPEFKAIVYNRRYRVSDEGILIEVGDINYGEEVSIIGDIEVPPLTTGSLVIGELQVSYVNPVSNELEFTTPIPIEIEAKTPEELEKIGISEEVLVKAGIIKTASKLEKALERGSKEIARDLNELVEMTMRIGNEELSAKTLSVKERIEREGLTPDLSKELASIISRIISGKIEKKKVEEK